MFRAYAIDLNEINPLIKNEPAQSIYNFENGEKGSLTQTILEHFNQTKPNDRSKQPTQKWEKALNWLYQNCHSKRG